MNIIIQEPMEVELVPWASNQSSILKNRNQLYTDIEKFKKNFLKTKSSKTTILVWLESHSIEDRVLARW